MLAIRMQRTGRKGHAMFRLIVQDSRRTPTSGNVVASLGNYDPHSKAIVLDKEKTAFYLEHGAQPSGRTAILLRREGVKLPAWVVINETKKGKPRHEKRQPKEQPAAAPAAVVTDEPSQDATPVDQPAVDETAVSDVVEDSPVDETPAEEVADGTESPAEPVEASDPETEVETATKETPTEASEQTTTDQK